jgi:isochorismate synthase
VRAAVRTATRTGQAQWTALRVEIPACDGLELFRASSDSERFYWERPTEKRSITALGSTLAIETVGANRFIESSARAQQLFAGLHVAGEVAPSVAGPFLVGGFAFYDAASTTPHWGDFPVGRLVLPEAILVAAEGRAWCTVTRSVAASSDILEVCQELRSSVDSIRVSIPSPEEIESRPPLAELCGSSSYRAVSDRTYADYREQVASALREIGDGAFEKLVLARSVCLRREGNFDPCALLDALRFAHPSCAVFAVARQRSVFLGATPECLVRLAEGRVETASVAGSAPRGRSPEEDLRLGCELRESKKEQNEHAVVVRALCDALAPHCDGLEVRESPRLMRLKDIQHLETPIAGTLRDRSSILDLLDSVHPTPAIAGAPREPAVAWLRRNEGLDRGWYGGPVGFTDAAGGGEFYAALRSALLGGEEARLFAGAGVVEGSQPEQELRETRLKFRAMLDPLLEI